MTNPYDIPNTRIPELAIGDETIENTETKKLTKAELLDLLDVLNINYPSFDVTQKKLDYWFNLLCVYDYEFLKRKIDDHILISSYAPTIADLIGKNEENKIKQDFQQPKQYTTLEETEKILQSIQKYYSSFEFTEQTVEEWYQLFKQYSYEDIVGNAKEHIEQSQPNPPTPQMLIPKGMELSDTIALLYKIKNYWEQFEITKEKVDTWHKSLKKHDRQKVLKELEYYAENNHFPPSLADVVPVKGRAVLTSEETQRMLSQYDSVQRASEDVIQENLRKMREILGIRRDNE